MSSYPAAAPQGGALSLLGIPIHPVGVDEVHEFIKKVITQKAKALILNVNVYAANLALQYPWFRDFFNEAQLVFCDGEGVQWGLKLLGMKPPPKITYDRWFWQLAEFCVRQDYSLYFLGSKPGVAQEAAERLREKFPSLKIVGIQDGYFSKTGEENERIVDDINRKKPDILTVGFGMPAQEKWLSENWKRIDAHVFLDGGAVFDCVSGMLARPPAWMIRMHMEWFFRFLQQPGRRFVRYFIGIPYFFLHVLLEKLKRKENRGTP